ncbi:LysR family transcriptional regulator [Lutimaribacter sp. EGI FJ00015]|uniref:LysR family transcriptional regulator n=1 Tax=Lutimaribacter degradans TaxID=2945989 RepID=A0ACC5ZYM6_9RHOB|nr:LysR family transcriptional regulator [Lutimaribacter sp. EGI FJ00013]MCM2563157.1 LysR family transcriptional regulator [Lutimaribacter sp. EGI FJ00013]MCO0614336.1 LysR family transcriptional regulator [Lutimaribacter sp. EGI FJ00015]MCO0637146.1 LysR family transcriptional regulator [Lutimaribacter sp. EGI FJ00014]
MNITLRQIEAFRAVAELASFSRAAERLGTSQPALSQVIRDLETAVGVRLFDRTTRRVDLTEAGHIFAASALTALDGIARAVTDVQDMGHLRRGTVRVAAPPLLAATALPQAVAKVAKTHPGLTVKIADLGTDAIVAQVRTGQADLGLGTFPPGADGLDRVPVLQDELMVFTHDHCNGEARTWAGLSDAPLITLTRESGIRLLTEVGFETAKAPLRPTYEVHQVGTALALVSAGLGHAVLPAYARAAVGARPIKAVPLTDPVIAREITLITARDRAPSPATIAVRGIIRQVLRRIVG